MAVSFPPTGRSLTCLLALTLALLLPMAPEAAGQRTSSPRLGTTYHVAPGGDDGNSGSAANPWATLQHAADQVQAGDIVRVHPGTYTGFQIETSGTAAQPILFQATGSGVVVNAVNPVRGNDNINVEGADYVVIDGFRVRDADRAGIRVVIARGVVVKNNIVGPNGKWGIFTGFAHEVEILNNETFGSADEHGIYVSNSDIANDNPIIRGNISHSNQTNGIQLNGDCFAGGDGLIEGAVIEDNIVRDNHVKGFSLISIAGSVVRNNLIYENGITAGAGGIHLVDEPGCGKPTVNTVVVNNTIVEPRIAGIRMNDGATNNTIFNNLVVSNQPIRDEVGGNLIDAVSNHTSNSTAGLFVNAPGGNYHLDPNSPALNAGVASFSGAMAPTDDIEGNTRPLGGGWDVGAYERTGQAFTLTLKNMLRSATGIKKAVLRWNLALVSTNKIDFYVDEAPDGTPLLRTRNDKKVKLKLPTAQFPGDGPFAIQGCEKNSTTVCSNIVSADFSGVPVDVNEPDGDDPDDPSFGREDDLVTTEPVSLSNYPNPFNPTTVVSYTLPEAEVVSLRVFNLLGQEVATLVDRHQAEGTYEVAFDATHLSAGIYFYVLQTDAFTQTERMTLLK